MKRRWRFKFDQARQKFLLTPAEKRVVVFVLAAFTLGLGTKCYRDAHPSPAPLPSTKVHRSTAGSPTGASVFQSPAVTSAPTRRRTQKNTPP
ncbi:MAG: hypothetical protein DME69_10510 [Verrucomicrobia bacterium]|nr:MAG: hypothetical protein DME69_10510 [Verrucomicrobiota bacterium]